MNQPRAAEAVAAFQDFVARARLLQSQGDLVGADGKAAVSDLELERFRAFAQRAEAIAIGRMRERLPAIRAAALEVTRWLTPHDLLAVSGRSRFEDPYTELLAWSLAAGADDATNLTIQRAWLRRMGFARRAREIDQATTPETQLGTDDGFIDLVLQYPQFSVVVEAKTDTSEHTTPLGRHQTLSYPAAFRRLRRLPPDHPVEVVFLTVDGSEAANDKAVLATWKDCALAIVDVLAACDLDHHLSGALAMLATHYLSDAGRRGTNLAQTIRDCATLLDGTSEVDTTVVLRELESLTVVYQALCEGAEHEHEE